MARIKGKWVGQVVVDYDFEIPKENECFLNDKSIRSIRNNTSDRIESKLSEIKDALMENVSDKVTVTVTQLYADLYRDDPSEWTKEEAN